MYVFGALLLCLVALTQWRAAANEAAAEASHPPLGQSIDVDGTRIHAFVQGEGPDLVLIHGSSGNLRDFTFRMVDALSDRYRVIAFDRPGLGYSETPGAEPVSLAEQARLLARAAQELGAEQPLVMGQSLGGAVALAWAIHHPENLAGLITVSAVSHPWESGLSTYYTVLSSRAGQWLVIPAMTAFVSDDRIDQAINGIFAPEPTPDGFAEHFGPRLTLRRATMRENALQRRYLLDWVLQQVDHYAQIEVPTEIVHGLGDETVGHDIHSRPLSQAIPDARLTSLDTASHMPQHTHMADVIAAIDRAAARAGLR